ncbi:uncharacterized protein LOC129771855 [Toxorhynchites rutilus septentrionalis]|uniref:uncharacterized protein LOC129764345 n=1 Tax=Toxorhynchites rutilus septentrionalis TaxID=329112 RepID=UPI00247A0AA0|nr:uncharacterized protein LOC129764345 [Toxorhynchites rutilus septentrionalis]XP_055619327.1 uncharacterized protein LOC129764359 [Toxorhynchites rutilus septentrionalis]XP_055619334.1 uncharacterized protein LOC129764366 [Toxorhynchites rutilus septentrionalis]XP_055622587.1 uncharacterized protein LOC129766147 [Toxorhynchites rutilus septentrionalis]XP_055624859.1 uncharacterized protein LOC129767728 [Toxorhynchites rutilus septentrionalis]XP_055631908.1 uncharacterized protein LOC12977184
MERGQVKSRIPTGSRIPRRSSASQETGVRPGKHRSSNKGVQNASEQQSEENHKIWFLNYNDPNVERIEDETPPMLVPSDIQVSYGDFIDSNTEWIEDITPPQLVPSDIQVWFGNLIDSNAELIEDITPPQLVPSDTHLEDDIDDVCDWEPGDIPEINYAIFKRIKAERDLCKMKAENEKLQQENQRLKAKTGVSLISRCCFRFLLFMVGEVAESIFSSF